MHHVTILDTTDLVEDFERSLGYHLGDEDRLEIFNQIFQLLDQHTPPELVNRKLLYYDALVFANHLKVDHVAVDQIAYRLLVKVWQVCQARNFYVDGSLMYFPFGMHGMDLCVRRYNS